MRRHSAKVSDSGIGGYRFLVNFLANLMQFRIISPVDSDECEYNSCISIPKLAAAA